MQNLNTLLRSVSEADKEIIQGTGRWCPEKGDYLDEADASLHWLLLGQRKDLFVHLGRAEGPWVE